MFYQSNMENGKFIEEKYNLGTLSFKVELPMGFSNWNGTYYNKHEFKLNFMI